MQKKTYNILFMSVISFSNILQTSLPLTLKIQHLGVCSNFEANYNFQESSKNLALTHRNANFF
jgi:hypothetical protein